MKNKTLDMRTGFVFRQMPQSKTPIPHSVIPGLTMEWRNKYAAAKCNGASRAQTATEMPFKGAGSGILSIFQGQGCLSAGRTCPKQEKQMESDGAERHRVEKKCKGLENRRPSLNEEPDLTIFTGLYILFSGERSQTGVIWKISVKGIQSQLNLKGIGRSSLSNL